MTLHFVTNLLLDKSWARFSFSANLLKCLMYKWPLGLSTKKSALTRWLTWLARSKRYQIIFDFTFKKSLKIRRVEGIATINFKYERRDCCWFGNRAPPTRKKKTVVTWNWWARKINHSPPRANPINEIYKIHTSNNIRLLGKSIDNISFSITFDYFRGKHCYFGLNVSFAKHSLYPKQDTKVNSSKYVTHLVAGS